MNRRLPVITLVCVALTAATSLGVEVSNYASHAQSGNVITINCSSGTQKVRITVCTPSIIKVDFDTRGTFVSTQDLLSADFTTKAWTPVQQPTVTDKGTSLEIQTGTLTIAIQKTPIRIKYYNTATGALITGDTDNRGMTVGSGIKPWVQLTKQASEHYFGWGMAYAWYMDASFRKIDKTGTTYEGKCLEAPFMYSTGGYGIFCLFSLYDPGSSIIGYTSYGAPAPGYDLRTNAAYWPATDYPMDYLSYYFIAGSDYRTVIDGYTQISGKPPKIGKKWYGIWRDIYLQGGVTPADFQGIADSWRSGRFPIDNIRNDQFFDWGKFGYATPPSTNGWNSALPAAVLYVKNRGYTVGGMMNGYGYGGCCGGRTDDAVVQDSAHAKTSVDHGFDFAWYDAMLHQPRAKAQRQWEAWKYAHGGDESKVWVVKGWFSLSSQAFPGCHTGDDLENPTWAVVPATLEQHIVGYSVSGTDLGEGLDWNYIGTAMRPVASYHQSGAAGGIRTSDFKVWTYAADLQQCIRKWSALHYRFIPYFFTYGMIANQTGMPIWRHMVCQDPTDATGYSKDRQAFVGDNVIISPYYPDGDNNTGSRGGIYLPKGEWFDYFEGTKYTGPTTINYAVDPGTGVANKKLPMFVRAGAIIPLMDTLQYIGEKPETLMTICAWPSGTSQFTLYEDETSVTTALQCVQGASQTDVVIGPFSGSVYCPDASKRRYAVEVHGSTAPQTVVSAGVTLTKQVSKAALDAAASGWFFDAAKGGVTYVKAVGSAASGFTVSLCQSGQCAQSAVREPLTRAQATARVTETMRQIALIFEGEYRVQLITTGGKTVSSFTGRAPSIVSLPPAATGVYLVKVSSAHGSFVSPMMLR